MVNGLKEGKWTYYYPSGIKEGVEFYKADKLHGKLQGYDFDGLLIREENWENDILCDSATYFFSNGNVEKAGRYTQSQYSGKWWFYYVNGTLKRTLFYKDGLPHGEWKYYNEKSVLTQSGFFKNGKESGSWTFYDNKGRAMYSGTYTNGKKTGDWYTIKKNGKKKLIDISGL